ncbi:OVARIAN TUMOR DOMAIN-containing deubiquitinating enzyme 9 [Linum perenne]
MIVHEQDPDVVRWGLHTLIDVCAIRSNGSCSGVTHEADQGQVGYVSEFYNEPAYINNIESDAVIARALQEELSYVAAAEASGRHDAGQDSILAQDWSSPSKNWKSYGQNEADGFSHKKAEESDQVPVSASPSFRQQNYPSMEESPYDIDIADEHDEYALDGEVGKRINQMVPIPLVPKINGEIPTLDEEVSDHQRLLDRLKVYFLVENKVQGDGNCQLRALSDQLYRSSDHHIFVRQQVVNRLRSHSEIYEGYVPMPYNDYLNNISKSSEWGDHVTLQAAADSYGVKIFVLTSFKDTCYIEIIPHVEKSKRIIYLSFWAEVHYNSIYPEGGNILYIYLICCLLILKKILTITIFSTCTTEIPINEEKKKKKWWRQLLSS